MFDYLAEHHLKGVRMGLVHGRMPADEKQRAISDFKEGRISVLVSTTVIEVGVDAPDATVMVVEHADRFGLSQLHQLRGRVGRGLTQSYCYLIAGAEYSENAFNRLSVMAETNDGFRIAEEDLKQRGPGEYLGSRQAGMPDDLLLLMVKHPELIEESRKAAAALLAADANLSTPSNEELKLKLMNEWGRKLRFADA